GLAWHSNLDVPSAACSEPAHLYQRSGGFFFGDGVHGVVSLVPPKNEKAAASPAALARSTVAGCRYRTSALPRSATGGARGRRGEIPRSPLSRPLRGRRPTRARGGPNACG